MTKVDALRKLIREEVRTVFREELNVVLLELRKPKSNVITDRKVVTKPYVEKRVSPRVLQEEVVHYKNPIDQILAETARTMNTDDYRTLIDVNSNMAQGFQYVPDEFNGQLSISEPKVVNTVTEMLANTRPVTDINQVQIDTVPDFSGLMQTLIDKGKL